MQILLNDSGSHARNHLHSPWNLPHDSIVLLPIFFTKRGNCKDMHSVNQSTCFQKQLEVQFDKDKTWSSQCAHTTEIRGDQAPPSLFRWILESSTELSGTPVRDSFETSHHHSNEVLFMSGKNTYMGGKELKTTKDICKECMEKKTQKSR